METLNQILDEIDTGQELLDTNIIKEGDDDNDKASNAQSKQNCIS